MKIAITSSGNELNSQVEARFGRCQYFLIIDTETMQFEALENPNIALGGGAGIQSAQLMSQKGVQTVLTGSCGPNAYQTFGAAGVQVITGVSGIVRNAIDQFNAGTFSISAGPNVESHAGMAASPSVNTNAQSFKTTQTNNSLGNNLNPGMGGSGGRGMGGGGGQGMGGGGRGMGGGCGKGGGRGMGMGAGMMNNIPPISQDTPKQPDTLVSREQELETLNNRAQTMTDELKAINEKIRNLKKSSFQ